MVGALLRLPHRCMASRTAIRSLLCWPPQEPPNTLRWIRNSVGLFGNACTAGPKKSPAKAGDFGAPSSPGSVVFDLPLKSSRASDGGDATIDCQYLTGDMLSGIACE